MESAGARRVSAARIERIERVLVVRLGAIGDCLRVLPAVARLREAFPSAEIDWAVGDLAAPLLEGHPILHRLHVVRRREMKAGLLAACSELHRVGTALEARNFDVAIDFHTRLKSGYLVRASRAPMRIGFDRASGTEANFLFTNTHVRLEDRYENRVTRFARLLAPLGIDAGLASVADAAIAKSGATGCESSAAGAESEERRRFSGPADGQAAEARQAMPGLWLPPGEIASARSVYESAGRPPVAIFAGTSASRADDRWPTAKWREVVARLGAAGVASMVLWGPGDEASAQVIHSGSSLAQVAPPTSIRGMMALLGCFALYIGANTAALHMAWMQGVPSVVLAGGRPHRTDRPLPPVPSVMLSAGDEPVRKLRGEAARRAVEGIEVEDVVRAALELVRKGSLA